MKYLKLNKQSLVDYFFIAVGAAIMAIGIGVFLVDARVVPGGVSGLSMAINYMSGGKIPIGLTIWVLNLPLYFWGIKELGKQFGVRTFFGFTFNAFFIDFFRGEIPGFTFVRLQDSVTIQNLLNNDFLFLILIGASLLGIGLGIVFKFRGSTAGTDIVAAILQKKFGIKPGMGIMIADFFVICFAGFVIEYQELALEKSAITLTLYALFLLFVSSKLVDAITDGFDYARAAYIISDKHKEIAEVVMKDFSRGATALKARGLYKNVDREILVSVVAIRELSKLTNTIKQIDPNAFVTVHNVHEVLGEGFRRRI